MICSFVLYSLGLELEAFLGFPKSPTRLNLLIRFTLTTVASNQKKDSNAWNFSNDFIWV